MANHFSGLQMPRIAEEPYTGEHGKCQACPDDGEVKRIDEERDPLIDVDMMHRDEGREVLSGVLTRLTFDLCDRPMQVWSSPKASGRRVDRRSAAYWADSDVDTVGICHPEPRKACRRNTETGDIVSLYVKYPDGTADSEMETAVLLWKREPEAAVRWASDSYKLQRHLEHGLALVKNARRELATVNMRFEGEENLWALTTAAVDAFVKQAGQTVPQQPVSQILRKQDVSVITFGRKSNGDKEEVLRELPGNQERGHDEGVSQDTFDLIGKPIKFLDFPPPIPAKSHKRALLKSSKHSEQQASSSTAHVSRDAFNTTSRDEHPESVDGALEECMLRLAKILEQIDAEHYSKKPSKKAAGQTSDQTTDVQSNNFLQTLRETEPEKWQEIVMSFVRSLTNDSAGDIKSQASRMTAEQAPQQTAEKPLEKGAEEARQEAVEQKMQEMTGTTKGKARKRKPRHKRA